MGGRCCCSDVLRSIVMFTTVQGHIALFCAGAHCVVLCRGKLHCSVHNSRAAIVLQVSAHYGGCAGQGLLLVVGPSIQLIIHEEKNIMIISRLGQSKGLLYKHSHNSFIN